MRDIDYPQTEDIGWRDLAPWEENKHPRGQPKNPGEFAKGGGGGGKGPAPQLKAPQASPESPKEGASGAPTKGKETAGGEAGREGAPRPAKGAQAEKGTQAGDGGPAASLLPEPPPALPKEQMLAWGDKVAASVGATEAVAQARQKLIAKAGWTTKSPPAEGGFFDKSTNSWTPERQKEHQRIIGQLFSTDAIERAMPEPGKKPTMVVLGGRGGSGKSWFSKPGGGVLDASKFIVIDSDAFKSQLPEYQGWNAALLHDECDHLVELAAKQAQAMGLNVIHDATVNSEKGVATRVLDYQKQGYDIEGHYMFCPPEEAAKRAMQRFVGGAKGDRMGRFVPPEVVLSNRTNERNFDKLVPQFARWSVYDNSAPGGKPRFVAGEGVGDGAGSKPDGGDETGKPANRETGSRTIRAGDWVIRIRNGARADRRLSG